MLILPSSWPHANCGFLVCVIFTDCIKADKTIQKKLSVMFITHVNHSAYIWELIEVAHLLFWVILPVFPVVEVDTEPTQLWKHKINVSYLMDLMQLI